MTRHKSLSRLGRQLRIQALEDRALMHANVDLHADGSLVIDADPQGTIAEVSEISDGIQVLSADMFGNVQRDFFERSQIGLIVFHGGISDDRFTDNTDISDRAEGGDGDDTLIGGPGASILNGGRGNDTLDGRGGDDMLHGNAGTDRVYGGVGNDHLFGDGGADQLFGGEGADMLRGGSGNDTIHGNAGADWIYGDAGNDQVYGDSGADQLFGGDGADTLRGGSGNDTIHGNAGDDRIYGDAGNDHVYGDSGADQLFGGDGNDILHGNAGADQVYGDAGNDRLYGDAGNDQLFGGVGDDCLFAGAGSDTLHGGAGADTLVSIDADAADNLFGDSGDDSFWGDRVGYSADRIRDASTAERSSNMHFVGVFANGADKTLNGDAIPDPVTSLAFRDFSDHPLFANGGPTARDIDQNNLGDCWLMAGLGAAAQVDPNAIRQTVVDLGDGTYAVELGGSYYRVDGDLPTTSAHGTSLAYAGLGLGGSIWAPIVEKAYAFYRTGVHTYASLDGGWPSEVFRALEGDGVASVSIANAGQALTYLANQLALGRAVSVNIDQPVAGAPLVPTHAYIVVSVDPTGSTLVLRNPWGHDGPMLVGPDDGLVTVTAQQLVRSMYAHNGIQSVHLG